LKQERTRVANRMNGLLANQGLWLPPGTDVGAAAKTVRLWDGSPVPAALRGRLEREWEHAQFLRTRILELAHEFAEIRRSANTGWGDRPAWSARIEGRPRPFGQDECRGKLPAARHSTGVRSVSVETGA
jgi:hypothetical protein